MKIPSAISEKMKDVLLESSAEIICKRRSRKRRGRRRGRRSGSSNNNNNNQVGVTEFVQCAEILLC